MNVVSIIVIKIIVIKMVKGRIVNLYSNKYVGFDSSISRGCVTKYMFRMQVFLKLLAMNRHKYWYLNNLFIFNRG